MSITIEDKIEMFSKMIFSNIEVNSSEKKQRLIETQKKELESLKLEVEKKKKELFDAAKSKAEREKAKLIAQAKNQQHHLQVAQIQRAVQKVMERLYKKAADFADTEAYSEYLKTNIKTAVENLTCAGNIVFYVMEKDLQLCRDLLQEVMADAGRQGEYEVQKASRNIIGGVIAEDVENQLQMDLSLAALIEENRDMVGAVIARRFSEVKAREQ